jgi:hypothetical protein
MYPGGASETIQKVQQLPSVEPSFTCYRYYHPLRKVRVPRGCLLSYVMEASILQQLVPVMEQFQYTSEQRSRV